MEKVIEQPLPLVKQLDFMTEAEFEAWCDEDVKAEWIEGEVIVHSPATLKHVLIAGWLIRVVGLFVEHHDLGVVLGPELQIRLPGRRRVPDLIFIAKERLGALRNTYLEGSPDLAVEIVSADSVERDWREKYLEYEAHGVGEYWIIDPLSEQFRAYHLGQDNRYLTLPEEDGVIRSRVMAGFWLRPAWLWAESLPKPLEILRELGVFGA